MAERGKMRDIKRATQVRDYSGLQYGTITPTDIDAVIEYKNQCYIFIEAKHEGTDLPYGQKLALERLCDDLQKQKPAILIVGEHNTTGEIDFATMTVTKYYSRGRWITPKVIRNVREVTDSYLEFVADE